MPRQALIFVGGYVLAAAAGLAAAHAGIPLAWMLGPLAVAAMLSLGGAKTIAPSGLRRYGQLVIGCTVGLNVTGPVVVGLLQWLPIMIVTALIAILASATFSPVFARLGRLDRKTAFFALMPGGLAEMSNIGVAEGARAEPIALIHAVRVAIVVLFIPAAVIAQGRLASPEPVPDLPAAMVGLLLLAGSGGAWLAKASGLNNPWMIGALIASGMLSASGLMDGRMPHPLFAVGQILLGYNIGSRFTQETIRKLPRTAVAGAIVVVLLIVVMALYAWALSTLTTLDMALCIIAASPGGSAEMSTTAQVMHLEVSTVTAFHLIRTILVNGFSIYYWRIFSRSGYLDLIGTGCRRLFGP